MMQKNWRPSGWLGLLLGAKLYYDFSTIDDNSFNQKIVEIIKQLKAFGIHPGAVTTTTTNAVVPATTTVVESKKEYLEWNREKTMNWITSLGGDEKSFSGKIDGTCLEELQRLRQQNPTEKFIVFLLSYVTSDLATALKLSRALPTLR